MPEFSTKWDPKKKQWVHDDSGASATTSQDVRRLQKTVKKGKAKGEILDKLLKSDHQFNNKWDPKKKQWVSDGTATSKNKKNRSIWDRVKSVGKDVVEWSPPGVIAKGARLGAGPTMDLLSRTGYASAEGSRRSAEYERSHKGNYNPLSDLLEGAKGAVAGISGKKKTSYSKVLEEAGVKNKWVKGIGGFVGDVVLDPSTYVSFGLSEAKPALEIAQSGAALAVKDALKSAAGKKIAREESNKVIKQLAGSMPHKELIEKANAAGREAGIRYAEDFGREAKEKLLKENARKLQIKAGNGVVAEFKTPGKVGQYLATPAEQGTKVLGRGAKKLVQNEAVQIPNALFRNQAKFPGRWGHRFRQLRAGGMGNWEAHAADLERDLGKGLDNTQRHALVGIVEGEAHTPFSEYGELGQRAQDIADQYLQIDTLKKEWGLVDAERPALPGYVYHHGKGQVTDEVKGMRISRKARKDPDGNWIVGKNFTTEASKKAGTKIEEDAVDQVKFAWADLYNRKARKDFSTEVHNLVAVTPGKGNAKLFKEMDMVPSSSEFSRPSTYVPRQVNDMMKSINKIYDVDEDFKRLQHFMDKAVGAWKVSATVMNPGHHVRNFSTDMVLSFLDGMQNPLAIRRGFSAFAHKANVKAFYTVAGERISAPDLWKLYYKSGGKSGFFRQEFARGAGEGIKGIRHAPVEKLRALSESREDMGRFVHWMWALDKEAEKLPKGLKSIRSEIGPGSKALDKAAENSAQRITEMHIDYSDFTHFEQTTMKRLVPFYSWLRKSTPLMLKTMFEKPGRVAIMPKGMRAIQTLLGQDPSYPGFSQDQTIPQWLREMLPVQISGGNDDAGTNTMFAPQNPLVETLNNIKDPLRTIESGLNPLAKIPIELGTNKNLFTKGPALYPGESTKDYMLRQIPQGRIIQKQGKAQMTRSAWLNWLAGAGVYDVNDTSRKSELRRQQDPIDASNKKKKDELRKRILEQANKHG